MTNTNTLKRPPIVAVLGHVDHGKTSLLDKIRKSDVQGKEAGGITQSIGASVVATKEGGKITFIDTPGHAAFSNMRSRGANAADIAILVVAADDGVKPQTVEAIKYIKEAGVPYVAALTKIDLPSANLEAAKGSLEKEGLLLEGRGGDIPNVPLSSKTGEGVEELLETILLLSEVSGVSTSGGEGLKAVVIETSRSKAGPLVSAVIRSGTIKVGETVYSESRATKVRGLFDSKGVSVKEVSAGYPVQIIGFETLPEVGSIITSLEMKNQVVEGPKEDLMKGYKSKLDKDEYPVVIKASSTGSLEAVLKGVPKKLVVIVSGVGDVTENEVLAAKSSGAIVFAFESKVPSTIQKLAKTEGVEVYKFDIIYKLFEKMEEILRSDEQVILGTGEIIAEFPFDGKKVAGCRILTGAIAKGATVILKKGEKEVGKAKVISVRKGKQEVPQAKPAEECGILLEPQLDFNIHDVLVSVQVK